MKKKKTYAAVLFAAGLLSLGASFSSFAHTEGFSEEYYRFQDPDGLLSDEDQQKLNEKMDEISREQQFDVTAALVNSLDGKSTQDYADDLYDECDFGYGEEHDGTLLLVSLEDRDWYISTSGYGIDAFSDRDIQYIGEEITPFLSDENYVEAFENYADLCDIILDQKKDSGEYEEYGDYEDYETEPASRGFLSPIWILISLVAGFAGALVTVGVNKGKLKSVRMQKEAQNYVRPGSMHLTTSSDHFLYRNVTRTPKPQPKSSPSGGGGGSSTHTSSSGRTHGGGGGKF